MFGINTSFPSSTLYSIINNLEPSCLTTKIISCIPVISNIFISVRQNQLVSEFNQAQSSSLAGFSLLELIHINQYDRSELKHLDGSRAQVTDYIHKFNRLSQLDSAGQSSFEIQRFAFVISTLAIIKLGLLLGNPILVSGLFTVSFVMTQVHYLFLLRNKMNEVNANREVQIRALIRSLEAQANADFDSL